MSPSRTHRRTPAPTTTCSKTAAWPLPGDATIRRPGDVQSSWEDSPWPPTSRTDPLRRAPSNRSTERRGTTPPAGARRCAAACIAVRRPPRRRSCVSPPGTQGSPTPRRTSDGRSSTSSTTPTARRAARDQRERRAAALTVVPDPESVPFPDPELFAALEALPDKQRSVLVLRYWADWDEAAIADALGCRRATVRSHARRGLAHLRSRLEEAS